MSGFTTEFIVVGEIKRQRKYLGAEFLDLQWKGQIWLGFTTIFIFFLHAQYQIQHEFYIWSNVFYGDVKVMLIIGILIDFYIATCLNNKNKERKLLYHLSTKLFLVHHLDDNITTQCKSMLLERRRFSRVQRYFHLLTPKYCLHYNNSIKQIQIQLIPDDFFSFIWFCWYPQ